MRLSSNSNQIIDKSTVVYMAIYFNESNVAKKEVFYHAMNLAISTTHHSSVQITLWKRTSRCRRLSHWNKANTVALTVCLTTSNNKHNFAFEFNVATDIPGETRRTTMVTIQLRDVEQRIHRVIETTLTPFTSANPDLHVEVTWGTHTPHWVTCLAPWSLFTCRGNDRERRSGRFTHDSIKLTMTKQAR